MGWRPRDTLLIGMVIGLALGFLVGRSFPGKAPPASARSVGAPTGGSAVTAGGDEVPLRLREQQWREDENGFCTGVFEVITTPPGVKGLVFSAMNAQGEVIGTDRVSAPQGIRPNSVLELGFEVRRCADIEKWKAQMLSE